MRYRRAPTLCVVGTAIQTDIESSNVPNFAHTRLYGVIGVKSAYFGILKELSKRSTTFVNTFYLPPCTPQGGRDGTLPHRRVPERASRASLCAPHTPMHDA